MTTLATTESTAGSVPAPSHAGHRFTLLVSGGDDGMMKVLTTLRSRRYAVRDLQARLAQVLAHHLCEAGVVFDHQQLGAHGDSLVAGAFMVAPAGHAALSRA